MEKRNWDKKIWRRCRINPRRAENREKKRLARYEHLAEKTATWAGCTVEAVVHNPVAAVVPTGPAVLAVHMAGEMMVDSTGVAVPDRDREIEAAGQRREIEAVDQNRATVAVDLAEAGAVCCSPTVLEDRARKGHVDLEWEVVGRAIVATHRIQGVVA